ncbi:DUF5719 family protein [Microbacterium dextranolyticum]|uniref:Large extracellular alpha-helical protein n=1 Tax=Microbacterium dextranolyticum TaxID=36806 RepID=A0A9W6M6Z9_9MICO|nr:DUF5719 family protein [Microbacterium dextranolyticum]MBM7463732.1 hypothetical protein [Microbacterium dextranolyticum]GLJ96437.1 hypothetical protein GCM10017591_25000 [Microbacterium dextranolyticum]
MSSSPRTRAIGYVVGALVTAAVVAAAGAVIVFDAPSVTRDVVAVDAQPPAAESVAACVGPLLASGRDSTQAALLTDAAAQAVTSGVASGGSEASTSLTQTDVAAGEGATVVSAPPASDGTRTDLSAAGSARVSAADLSGFAASACMRAQPETWLVGGAATTGAADLVLLANPGDVPALVTLTVYGATGRTAPAAGKGIVVAAHSQRTVALASLALGEENPVVHVVSSQAPVRAALQTSFTRGLVPTGVDQVSAAGAPATTLLIPGVPVVVPPGDAGASNVATSLRLVAPDGAGTATVTVESGAGAVQTQSVPLIAGVPLHLDLGSLPVGTYTVRVAATVPVTGAVWATTGFGQGSDFGWFTPAHLLGEPALVAVAAGPSSRITFAAPDGAAEQVTLSRADGSDARQIPVPAGGSATVPVDADAVYRLSSESGPFAASVSYAANGAIAGYSAQPGDAATSAIVVRPR